jgi:hypothetical protein
MENFRDFSLGPDPFGRTWRVQFKYLQTAISIRHSDSVDVCFILTSGVEPEAERLVRTVVIPHGELRAFSQRTGAKIGDAWCSRIAYCRLRHAVLSGEDIDKEYLVVTPRELEEYTGLVGKWEEEWLKSHAA